MFTKIIVNQIILMRLTKSLWLDMVWARIDIRSLSTIYHLLVGAAVLESHYNSKIWGSNPTAGKVWWYSRSATSNPLEGMYSHRFRSSLLDGGSRQVKRKAEVATWKRLQPAVLHSSHVHLLTWISLFNPSTSSIHGLYWYSM